MTSALPSSVTASEPATTGSIRAHGRHRAPTRTGRNVGRVAVAAVSAGAPVALGVGLAPAAHATNWDAIAQCESSGNWGTNTGNGFSGGLQFTPSTWHAFGGSGSPQNASRSEQIQVAEKVKGSQGMGAWPVCGSRGGGSSTPTSGGDDSDSGSSSSHETASPKAKPSPVKRSHKATVKPASSSSDEKYTVKNGDTLGKIADEQHVKGGWQSILDNNRGVISDPNMILPGQSISL